jgi:hypothetical protein
MDKQKQIQTEELIGIIQGAVGGCATHWASLIAEEVLKYYQPKIPENAVVLTREEDTKRFNGLVEYLKKVRKETAEKFAERVSKAFIGLNCIDIDEWNWCQNKIDEICEEIQNDHRIRNHFQERYAETPVGSQP